MIRFLFPELFLLAIPMWFAYRTWGRAPGVTGWLRLALLVVLLVAIAGPQVNFGGKGIDIIVVADRSRSLPAEAEPRIRELIENLQKNRGPGDRVALVTFGTRPAVESVLSHESVLAGYTKEIITDGSELTGAMHEALDEGESKLPGRGR